MSIIKNNYKKAFVEVEAVLNSLNSVDYNKIPKEVIDAIYLNKDSEYTYEYDESLDYEKWDLMPETKAILYNILKKYLATEEQKQYFYEKEKYETEGMEREKAQKYDSNNLFKKDIEKTEKDENNKLIVNKENFIRRILDKIRKIFKTK